MRALVLGATGRQGGAVARALLARGHHVTALSRSAQSSPCERLRQIGAEVVEGDIADTAALRDLMSAADGCYAVTSHGADLADDTEWRQGESIVAAAADAELAHLVLSSATFSPTNRFLQKLRVEQHLRARLANWTVVAPVMFLDNLLRFQLGDLCDGVLRLPIRADARLQWISSDDIGAFVVHALEHPQQTIGQRIQIATDELTGPQLAEIVSRHGGRPVAFETQSLESFEQASGRVGLSGFEYWNADRFPVDIDYLRRRFPALAWGSAESWAARQDWSSLCRDAGG